MLDTRDEILMKGTGDEYLMYKGSASNIYQMKLPMTKVVMQLLFAQVSIESSLSKKRKHNAVGIEEITVDESNPAANLETVSKQSYQNYKSALKWFHETTDQSWGKEGVIFPIELDKSFETQMQAYKKDIGSKKRRGVMRNAEGLYISYHIIYIIYYNIKIYFLLNFLSFRLKTI